MAAASRASARTLRAATLGANDRIGVGFIGVGQHVLGHVHTVKAIADAGKKLRLVGCLSSKNRQAACCDEATRQLASN